MSINRLMPSINSSNAAQLRAAVIEQEKFRPQYDFTRRFTAMAGASSVAQIPLPSEGDFEVIGYNIEYEIQANKAETILLRFKEQNGGKSWSNDMLPIRSIATPGRRDAVIPGVRYGYREFHAYLKANDALQIEWDNKAGTENEEVYVTFTGYLWRNY